MLSRAPNPQTSSRPNASASDIDWPALFALNRRDFSEQERIAIITAINNGAQWWNEADEETVREQKIKRLRFIVHPDKVSAEHKEAAQQAFQKIGRSYDVDRNLTEIRLFGALYFTDSCANGISINDLYTRYGVRAGHDRSYETSMIGGVGRVTKLYGTPENNGTRTPDQQRFLNAYFFNAITQMDLVTMQNALLVAQRDAKADYLGYTAVHVWANWANYEDNPIIIFDELVRQGIDIAALDASGDTFLHSAIFWQMQADQAVVAHVLNYCSINKPEIFEVRNCAGMTPVEVAATYIVANELNIVQTVSDDASRMVSKVVDKLVPLLFNGMDITPVLNNRIYNNGATNDEKMSTILACALVDYLELQAMKLAEANRRLRAPNSEHPVVAEDAINSRIAENNMAIEKYNNLATNIRDLTRGDDTSFYVPEEQRSRKLLDTWKIQVWDPSAFSALLLGIIPGVVNSILYYQATTIMMVSIGLPLSFVLGTANGMAIFCMLPSNKRVWLITPNERADDNINESVYEAFYHEKGRVAPGKVLLSSLGGIASFGICYGMQKLTFDCILPACYGFPVQDNFLSSSAMNAISPTAIEGLQAFMVLFTVVLLSVGAYMVTSQAVKSRLE